MIGLIACRVIGIDENNIINVSIEHLSRPNNIETPLKYNDVIVGSLVNGIANMIDKYWYNCMVTV